ncbi:MULTISPECIES: YbhB/YbcL family Raf kinase inhibitor-like protein [Thermomonospora]|uniref:Raf kinase inhibitor-like YbhB/YbcL family protein n=1 Tax=Thermomonospora cellulosilytica TaxID=1411118 RepID=A0A7W3N3A3_9ACTN|nr:MULTISPECIES: YbhB/YbcL family Raf kinase inhibitor-like protein [Thermomonospora]MBA9006791.1 Raf kinase inhibitor-like YbhB/YbcL family protein [Thermomonospora cellulosilytica]
MHEIELRSSAFNDHALIPNEYSHAAGDASPPLEWSNVPDETAELVLLCEDPDAPTGTFVHWLLAGIPPETEGLDAGESPTEAVEGRNDYGATGYGGPHPPVGDRPHRYFFRLAALSEPSGLEPGFTAEDYREAIEEKVIGTGTLVGTFGR